MRSLASFDPVRAFDAVLEDSIQIDTYLWALPKALPHPDSWNVAYPPDVPLQAANHGPCVFSYSQPDHAEHFALDIFYPLNPGFQSTGQSESRTSAVAGHVHLVADTDTTMVEDTSALTTIRTIEYLSAAELCTMAYDQFGYAMADTLDVAIRLAIQSIALAEDQKARVDNDSIAELARVRDEALARADLARNMIDDQLLQVFNAPDKKVGDISRAARAAGITDQAARDARQRGSEARGMLVVMAGPDAKETMELR